MSAAPPGARRTGRPWSVAVSAARAHTALMGAFPTPPKTAWVRKERRPASLCVLSGFMASFWSGWVIWAMMRTVSGVGLRVTPRREISKRTPWTMCW